MPYCDVYDCEDYDCVPDERLKPSKHEAFDVIVKIIEDRDKYYEQVQQCVRELCAIADMLGVNPDYADVVGAIRKLQESAKLAQPGDPLTQEEINVLRALARSAPRL